MRPPYCSEQVPCRTQCRACAECQAINLYFYIQQIEERERRYDKLFPPQDVPRGDQQK